MRRFGDNNELVKRGLRKDNRGRVYNIDDRNSRMIHDYDEELSEDETKIPPLDNETYQKFDKQKEKWIIDIEKKDREEKEKTLKEILGKIRELENKGDRPSQEINAGIDVEENKKYLLEYRTEINKLRLKVASLVAELKIA